MLKVDGHRFTCECWQCRGEEPKGSNDEVRSVYEFWENHEGPAIYSGQTISSVIVDVLNFLNIKIKGVNDHAKG